MTTKDPQAIDVFEHGDPISPSEAGSMHELSVQTHDPTAQIVVLDDRFKAAIKAAGSVAKTLPAGIYKVRVRRGASSIGFEDRLVVLDRDRIVSIEPPPLSSPAPIGGTGATEAHVAAREWLDGVVHVRPGKGSKVALLARYAARKKGENPLLHPFRGLQLLGADGRLLVDLEKIAPKPHVPDTEDPISICGIAVDPGAYILRHRLANGRELRQSVIASSGWQITINVRRTQEDVKIGEKLFIGAGYMALLMRRLIDGQSAQPSVMLESKDGPIDEDQLVDIARQGLADGAQLLSGNLYDLLLRDFDNPLAGIFGGLLLDLERDAMGKDFALDHAKLFDEAVPKLRKMVGPEHPDVEALSFRCPNVSLGHRGPIKVRPMFHRSWRMILEAASNQRNLVPLDLWESTTASGTMPPYLIWSARTAAKRASLRHLRGAAAHRFAQRIVRVNSPAPEERAEPRATTAPEGFEAIRPPKVDTGVTSTPSRREGAKVAPAGAASPLLQSKAGRLSRVEIALEIGVPANALQHLLSLTKLATRVSTNFLGKAKAASKNKKRGVPPSEANRAAGKAGSAAMKGISKKGAAGRKGPAFISRSSSTVKGGTKTAGRSSPRKPTRG
jgi:hypothetical protein